MNFVDIYQKYWKNGYTLTDLSLSGIDREVFRSLFNPVAEVFRKYPAGDVHLYLPGVGQVNGFQPGNYFDSAGTALASVDGSVGLVLDAAGSVGAELVTNGDFSQGAVSWSLSAGWVISGGVASCTASTLNINQVIPSSSVGKTFKVEFDLVVISGSIRAELGAALGGTFSSSGRYSTYITAATADQHLYIYGVTSFTGSIDNISCKQITGIHATQSTPGYKPTLRKGIVNLLTWSNDLTNAVWVKGAATYTSSKLIDTTANSIHRVYQQAAFANGQYTVAFELTAAEYSKAVVSMSDGSTGDASWGFDLVSGTVFAYPLGVGGWTAVSASISPVGNGKYLCCVSGAKGAGSVIMSQVLLHNGSSHSFAGTGSSGVYVTGVALFSGTLTAAQILAAGGIPLTTTAPASSQAGVNYLEFDGVDDRLSLGGPLFQMADDHCVVVGVSKESTDTNSPGVFGMSGGNTDLMGITFSSAWVQYFLNAGGSPAYRVSSSAYQSTPVVATGRKVGSSAVLRVNGVQQGAPLSTAACGSNVMTAATAGYRSYGGVASPLKGRMFPVLAIKGTVSDADLLVLEKFVAQLSGVTL